MTNLGILAVREALGFTRAGAAAQRNLRRFEAISRASSPNRHAIPMRRDLFALTSFRS